MNEKLAQFVDHARDRGMDHATIRQLLLSGGWKEQDIALAFCARDLKLLIPKPPDGRAQGAAKERRPQTRRKARDAFLHLLAYGSLYIWSTSLILLLFSYIEFAFPDAAWRTSYGQLQAQLSGIRAALAALIVSFPVFLLVWNVLLREIRRNPAAAQGVLRRWLGYLALFVGAITLSGNAMTLIYFLLEGQLTIRFLLQTAALFAIAGGLAGYLAMTMRSETQTQKEAVR